MMDFSHLYALDKWNFQSSLLKKCWCHFQAMLNMHVYHGIPAVNQPR